MEWRPLSSRDSIDIPFIESKGDFYHGWKEIAKEHKVFGFNYINEVNLVITDLTMLKDFSQKLECYTKQPLFINVYKLLTGEGLFTTEGNDWKRHRKFLSTAFNYNYIKETIPTVAYVVEEAFADLKKRGLKKINMLNEIQTITGEVVGRIFFGDEFKKYRIQGKPLTLFTGEVIGKIGGVTYDPLYQIFGDLVLKNPMIKKYKSLMDDIHELRSFCIARAKEIIAKTEESIKKGETAKLNSNLIQIFVHQNTQGENSFTEEEMINEFITFLVGGMDTTAHLISMATYQLLQNPKWQSKLIEEAKTIVPNLKDYSLDNIGKLDIMNAFIKESLRCAPPGSTLFERVAIKDHNLGNLQIKKGTVITIGIVCNHVDGEYFENPDTFDPSRWLNPESKTMNSVKKEPFCFVPFSAGPRTCIGQNLAQYEAKVVLSLFLKHFDYKLSDENYKLKMRIRFVYEPQEDIEYDLSLKN